MAMWNVAEEVAPDIKLSRFQQAKSLSSLNTESSQPREPLLEVKQVPQKAIAKKRRYGLKKVSGETPMARRDLMLEELGRQC